MFNPRNLNPLSHTTSWLLAASVALGVTLAHFYSLRPQTISPAQHLADGSWLKIRDVVVAEELSRTEDIPKDSRTLRVRCFAAGSPVLAIVADGGNVYVGGSFTSAGGVNATNIARWDGSAWSSLGTGLERQDNTGSVLALTMAGNNLYASGSFMIAGGVATTNVARWDGANWSPVGSGVGATDSQVVYALAAMGGILYAGGSFSEAGGLRVGNIAQWDGCSWSGLNGGGVTVAGQIEATETIGRRWGAGL